MSEVSKVTPSNLSGISAGRLVGKDSFIISKYQSGTTYHTGKIEYSKLSSELSTDLALAGFAQSSDYSDYSSVVGKVDTMYTWYTGTRPGLETTVGGHTTSIGNLTERISNEESKRAGDDSYLSGVINGINTTVGGHTTSIGNLQSRVSAIESMLADGDFIVTESSS